MIDTFRSYLLEAVSTSKLDKVGELVASYLSRRGGVKILQMPDVEKYSNSNGSGVGLRFFVYKDSSSFRLNFSSEGSIDSGSSSLESVDFWSGGGTDNSPDMNVEFDTSISLVKTLPIVGNILQGRVKPGDSIYTAPDGVPMNESTEVVELLEAARKGDPDDAYTSLLDMFKTGTYNQGKYAKVWKSVGWKILGEVKERHPEFFGKDGRKVVYVAGDRGVQILEDEKEELLTSIGAVRGRASRGGSSETYEASASARDIENNAERVAFEEQIEDLTNLVRLLVAGTSNALFVAGRGGVGKTWNVEDTLSQLGLSDGDGYFLNTGSVSAAGLYRLLFRHKNGLIVFDDADDVFKDQTTRNYLKNATDTKKVRKLVFTKAGANVVDEDEYESPEELLDDDKVPRSFEFKGQIIFISNLSKDKMDPDGALRTRGYMIDIDPTDDEVYDLMEKIVGAFDLGEGLSLSMEDRKFVVSILREGKSQQSANFRKLDRALKMAAGERKKGGDVRAQKFVNLVSRYA